MISRSRAPSSLSSSHSASSRALRFFANGSALSRTVFVCSTAASNNGTRWGGNGEAVDDVERADEGTSS